MHDLDIAGLTNALTDVIVSVTDDELKEFNLRKGVFNSNVDARVYEIISRRKAKMFHGGSSANVIHGAAALGLNAALFGTVGNDECGESYIQHVKEARIISCVSIADGPSGLCYTLVSSDGEKTAFAKIGVAGAYNFDIRQLEKTKIFHTSGYELLTNPQKTEETIDYAKKKGALISFDLACPGVVRERKRLESLLDSVSVLFTTEEEASALTTVASLADLKCPVRVLKKGKNGSVVIQGKKAYAIPIYEVKVVNTNGAGDAYAAGFLFGYIRGFGAEECGHFGSYLASRVCAREEAHL